MGRFVTVATLAAGGLSAPIGCRKSPPRDAEPVASAAGPSESDTGAQATAAAATPTTTAKPSPPAYWTDGNLHGVVTGASLPLVGARVRLAPIAPGAPSYADTGEDGAFLLQRGRAIKGAPPRVIAGAPGFRSRSFDLPSSFESTTTFDLEPLSPDNPAYNYRSAATCAGCHRSQVASWTGSRHATATVDPLFLDEDKAYLAWWQKVDLKAASEGSIYDHPFVPADAKGDSGKTFVEGGHRYAVLGDTAATTDCVKCHSPAYALAGGVDVRARSLATRPAVFSEGVGCDLCHKVWDVQVKTVDEMVLPGFDKAKLARPSDAASVMVGPFDDVVSPAMPATWSPVMMRGEGCATCHSDARVLRYQAEGTDGTPEGEVFLRQIWGEDTFREWKFSPTSLLSIAPLGAHGASYGASGHGPFTTDANYAGRPLACQDCHMQDPPPDPMTHERIAGYRDPALGETVIASHPDANPRDPRAFHPHRMEGRSRRFLEWATELSATTRRNGKQVEVTVTIANRHTGHAVPTGLPDRNLILLVDASDAGGVLDQTGGPRVPTWGSGDRETDPARDLAGRPGSGYARVLVDVDGNGPVHYLRAVKAIAQDNRLRVGDSDTTAFRFAAHRGVVDVRVRLLYRLRFKAQTDAYLKRHPGEDPGQFETTGDSLTLKVP